VAALIVKIPSSKHSKYESGNKLLLIKKIGLFVDDIDLCMIKSVNSNEKYTF
jgi:hypothetical protein